MSKNVFVIFSGSNDRAILTFVRKLSKLGMEFHVIARSKHDMILYTSYKKHVVFVRESNELSKKIFLNAINKVKRKSTADKFVIFPSSEFFNWFLLENISYIESLDCVVPLVEEKIYKLVTSKVESASYFSTFGVEIPGEYGSYDEVSAPYVAKPKQNITKEKKSLYPLLILNEKQDQKFKNSNERGLYSCQEYIDGESHYLLLYISKAGEVVCYAQQNLIQQADGKSMLYVVYSDLHRKKVATDAINALLGLNYRGFAMLEFIIKNQTAYYIELNPRPWGPLQFSEDNSAILDGFILDYTSETLNERSVGELRDAYLWFGGFISDWGAGKHIKWHINKKSLLPIWLRELKNDIYFQSDSCKYFFVEIKNYIIKR